MNRNLSPSISSQFSHNYMDDGDYSEDECHFPFEQRDTVRIRTNELFSDFYEMFDALGEGKFGSVYRCREKKTGLELAAKIVNLKKDADRKHVQQEVDIMQKMRHPKIAQIYDAFATNKNDIIVIMEIVKGGELFARVADENYVLTEMAVAMIIWQLCEAIDYIHSQNIVHLDIKPENIVCVSKTSNRIKLIDFGLAQYNVKGKDLLFMAGTPEFVAPETILFEPIDFRTDMWSVGVIVYILLSGISPFQGDNVAETYNNVTRGEWQFDSEAFEGISQDAKDFISNLLEYKKENRPRAAECLRHPWILNWREIARKNKSKKQQKERQINTAKLRRYILRRRWKKAAFTIFALHRMGWNMSNRRLVVTQRKPEHTKTLKKINEKPKIMEIEVGDKLEHAKIRSKNQTKKEQLISTGQIRKEKENCPVKNKTIAINKKPIGHVGDELKNKKAKPMGKSPDKHAKRINIAKIEPKTITVTKNATVCNNFPAVSLKIIILPANSTAKTTANIKIKKSTLDNVNLTKKVTKRNIDSAGIKKRKTNEAPPANSVEVLRHRSAPKSDEISIKEQKVELPEVVAKVGKVKGPIPKEKHPVQNSSKTTIDDEMNVTNNGKKPSAKRKMQYSTAKSSKSPNRVGRPKKIGRENLATNIVSGFDEKIDGNDYFTLARTMLLKRIEKKETFKIIRDTLSSSLIKEIGENALHAMQMWKNREKQVKKP